jgi:CheY-like chemotaxis protein
LDSIDRLLQLALSTSTGNLPTKVETMPSAQTIQDSSHVIPPRILIVEDEVIVALLLKEQLLQLGYLVDGFVVTAEEAISRIEESKPDLVLVDITLPGAMDGIDAAEVIQNRFHIPVVFSTGHSDEKTIQRAKEVFPFGYLIKPYRNSELKVTIDLALHAYRADVRRRAEEDDLRNCERTLSTLLSVPYAQFMLLDRQGRILSINRSAMDHLGKTEKR